MAGVPYKPAKYAMAIRSISAYPKPITSGEEALVLPGVGQSTALKIQEVIDTVYNLEIRLTEGHSKAVNR